VPVSAQRVGLKAIYTALLILTIEPLLLAINALPNSLLIPTETRTLSWLWYIRSQTLKKAPQAPFCF